MAECDTVTARLQYYRRRGKILSEKGEQSYHKRGKQLSPFLKYDEAATFYFQAAISFKCCGQWRQAADALIKCASMHKSLGLLVEAATFYTQAAETYMKVDRGEAIRAYRSAISIYCDSNMPVIAGKMERILAQLAFGDKHWEDAAAHYVKASNFLSGEMMFDQGDFCLMKAALCFIQMGEYREASRVYQIIAKGSADSNLRSFQACDYLLRSLLCLMATSLDIPLLPDGTQDFSKPYADKEKYNKVTSLMGTFPDIDYRWSTSKELLFAENIIAARLNFKIDEFADHIYWWHNIRPLDRECIVLLQIVLKEIEFELDRREKYGEEVQKQEESKMKRRQLNRMINRINEDNNIEASFLTEASNDSAIFLPDDRSLDGDDAYGQKEQHPSVHDDRIAGSLGQGDSAKSPQDLPQPLTTAAHSNEASVLQRLRLW